LRGFCQTAESGKEDEVADKSNAGRRGAGRFGSDSTTDWRAERTRQETRPAAWKACSRYV